MSTPYFNHVGRRLILIAEASSWLGTPFRSYARVKGVGVDCVNLAMALYQETGFLNGLSLPYYRVGEGAHIHTSKLEEWIEKCGRFERAQSPAVGDALCIRFGDVSHHVGVVTSDTMFIHVYRRQNATENSLADSFWTEKTTAIWRPIE
jgi:cell wall-associated NlpC family hydrolase